EDLRAELVEAVLRPQLEVVTHPRPERVALEPGVRPQRGGDEDAAQLVDLELDRRGHIDATDHRHARIEPRKTREAFLERLPLLHRVRDDAGVETAREHELVLCRAREDLAKTRRNGGPSLTVDRVFVLPSKHPAPPLPRRGQG